MSKTKIDEKIDSLVNRLLREVRVKLKKGLEGIMKEEREEWLKENDWNKGSEYYERSVKSGLCGKHVLKFHFSHFYRMFSF